MDCLLKISVLLGLAAVSVSVETVGLPGNYIITAPRKWTSGEEVRICVLFLKPELPAPFNFVKLTVKSTNGNSILVPERQFSIPKGRRDYCGVFLVPSVSEEKGVLHIDFDSRVRPHKRDLLFSPKVSKTFIQTDKFLYMPGQEVQFRVLTITGPYLKISTESYQGIWVETPSGSHIAQWHRKENLSGLIHLSFKLSEEPEKGSYKIGVKLTRKSSLIYQTFRVEDYVLPRFELRLKAPTYVLGTTEQFNVSVCAEYTYGQPVKGDLKIEYSSRSKSFLSSKIAGCKDVVIDALLDPGVFDLTVKATVIEEGTGEVLNETAEIPVERTAFRFKSVGEEKLVKPNLPFTGKIRVEWPDGSPALNESMTVCHKRTCKILSTDEDGLVEFIVPPSFTKRILIKSLNYQRIRFQRSLVLRNSVYKFNLKKYSSPSGSSLIIYVPKGSLPCQPQGSQEHILPVMFSSLPSKVVLTVQVISRGQMQYSKTEEYNLALSSPLPINYDKLLAPLAPLVGYQITGVIHVPITLPSTASPTVKVIVWYVRDDGELVSDTKEIKVARCFTNPVSLQWSETRVQPGQQARLALSTQPQSTCSLGVVDKSVELLSSQKDELTLEKIFDVLEQFMIKEDDVSESEFYQQCEPAGEGRSIDWMEPSGFRWKRHTGIGFRNGHFCVGSNCHTLYNPRKFYSTFSDAVKMFDKSGLYFISDISGRKKCPKFTVWRYRTAVISYDDFQVQDAPHLRTTKSRAISARRDSRRRTDHKIARMTYSPDLSLSYEPVTLLENQEIPRSYFPETWLWQFSSSGPTGVVSQELTLPDTITEWVGKAICVHPDKGLGISNKASITTFTPFFADLTLPPSVKRGEILPVKISIFNYHEADLPVKVILEESSEYEILPEPEGSEHLSGQRSSCVPQQDKAVHTIRIRPTVNGDVNITVNAFVDEMYPARCGPEFVVYKRDSLIKPIKVEIEGFLREKTWTKYICSKDIEDGTDSLERWEVAAPSNIVSDSARGWVTAVGDLLGSTLKNLGSLVRMPYGCGEQNMLNFAPNIFILQYLDASNQDTDDIFSKAVDYMEKGYRRELNYRHDDGSYSAFGKSDDSGSTWLTAFVLKSFAQARQYIKIDTNVLEMSRFWLKKNQLSNGCFNSVGTVLHKGLKGGIAEAGSLVPLTSYVLISLLEAGEPTTSSVMAKAALCLHANETNNLYTEALKAYALALSQDPSANSVVQKLVNTANETSNSMHWELPKESGMSDAAAIETAGYVILAMMTLDAEKYGYQAGKIVKWISTKQNGQGGFISTQDTVVALQALATYEAHQNQGSSDLVVKVDGTGLEHTFFISNSNKLLQQMVNIPSIPNSISIGMEGGGCALVQTVLRYNIPEPPPSEAFLLTVETETAPDNKCKTKRIKTCSSYQHPDGKSNMVVIEIDLVSGYIPEKADLKQIVGLGTRLFKRYEVDGSKITFYIDELTSRTTCLDFRIILEVEMEDVKPGTVKVYDYYQPEYSVSTRYTLPPDDECFVGTS